MLWLEAVEGELVRVAGLEGGGVEGRGRAGVVGGFLVVLAAHVRVIDTQLAALDLVFVEVTHGRCGGVGVGEFCESEALGAARVGVVDEPEVDDLAYAAADGGDLLFC